MKTTLLAVVGIGILVFAAALVGNSDGLTSSFGSQPEYSTAALVPEYVEGDYPPSFPPECVGDRSNGGDRLNVSGGGYGFNADLKHHTENSLAIVEGVARLAGPAFQLDFVSGTDRSSQMATAGWIRTPFEIEVSETYKGTEKRFWDVSVVGGLVGSVSYRQTDDGVTVYDGQVGLFFISSGSSGHQDDRVAMAIAESGPDWFVFTEENFESIEDAVELIRSVE